MREVNKKIIETLRPLLLDEEVSLEDIMIAACVGVMQLTFYNQTKSAKLLKVSRKTLRKYYLMGINSK